LTVDQPSASGALLMFAGPFPIPPGAYGEVTADCPVFALYDATTGTPSPGDVWGSEAGSYMLANGSAGYQILGAVSIGGSGSGSGGPTKAMVMPAVAADDTSFVRLTGNPGSECNYQEGFLQVFVAGSGGCLTAQDGERVDVLDLNNPGGSGSGS
jgi:hypothetical protein